MNLQQALRNQQLKKQLESRKQDRIKKKLLAKQRQKVNLDHSHLKTGKVQKTKIIQKKVFKTQVQKARKIDVQIQSNSNPSTYCSQSQQYLTILNRTKNYIKFDKQKLQQGCKAITAYAESNKQYIITLQLVMQDIVQCNLTPVMLRLTHPQDNTNCIVITNQKQQIQTKAINDLDMRIMSVPEFVKKYRTDKKFKKQISHRLTKIFCDFKVFTLSKMVKKLMQQNIPVFPIDLRKVPYSLQQQMSNYKDYLKLLLNSKFGLVKQAKQHRLKIKNQNQSQLADNIISITHQFVARLIQKNKAKGNKLINAKIKTQSSIPIDIYSI